MAEDNDGVGGEDDTLPERSLEEALQQLREVDADLEARIIEREKKKAEEEALAEEKREYYRQRLDLIEEWERKEGIRRKSLIIPYALILIMSAYAFYLLIINDRPEWWFGWRGEYFLNWCCGIPMLLFFLIVLWNGCFGRDWLGTEEAIPYKDENNPYYQKPTHTHTIGGLGNESPPTSGGASKHTGNITSAFDTYWSTNYPICQSCGHRVLRVYQCDNCGRRRCLGCGGGGYCERPCLGRYR